MPHAIPSSRPRPIPCAAAAALLALTLLGTAAAPEASIRCANLIYAGTHTSRCFSDEFLSVVQRETGIATERRFKAVKLGSDELFEFPFAMMTGEADFHFTTGERENLQRYLTSGGFLLASAGCSSKGWDAAFRRELRALFPDAPLTRVPLDHALFRTLFTITELRTKSPGHAPFLEGIELNGKLVVVYSSHGLNDTANTEGCCCCGGNEIRDSMKINANVLMYALIH